MPRIDIHTILGFCPKPKKHEILVITRGATASLNYPLFDKVYKIDNIDQFTYLFKQGKNVWAFEMIEYYKLTSDTVARFGKIYYNRIDINIPKTSCYKFEIANVTPGSTILPNTLYEEGELQSGEVNENWQFNSHFKYYDGDYASINFILNSEETKEFKPTAPECNIQCEATIKLNTDNIDGMHSQDSIIITPQHPIAVVDSLYSKIE